MAKCAECVYAQPGSYRRKEKAVPYICCDLTHRVLSPEAEGNCDYYNANLSEEDICYNCRFYGGGGDWGLFCSHPKQYHHLGRFNDIPCRYYDKKS